jgi:hypothetical protein
MLPVYYIPENGARQPETAPLGDFASMPRRLTKRGVTLSAEAAGIIIINLNGMRKIANSPHPKGWFSVTRIEKRGAAFQFSPLFADKDNGSIHNLVHNLTAPQKPARSLRKRRAVRHLKIKDRQRIGASSRAR